MRKSKSDTAETRKRIVSTAAQVFLDQGIAATGIADVMAAAGLTQGGFYRHFDSKEQLIAEANCAAFDDLLTMFETRIAGKPPREALDTIVHLYLHQRRGKDPVFLCPLANLGSELQRWNEEVKAAAIDGYQRLVQLVAVQIERLEIRDPQRVADAIVSMIVGAVTLSQLAPDPTKAKAILVDAQYAIGFLSQSAEGPRCA
jgi:TetR/AcrR family transcriptional repressor of nem operon